MTFSSSGLRRLEGRNIVVTGAGSGIGRASAKFFAAEGAHVSVWDMNEPGIEKTVSDITDAGGRAHGVYANVADAASVTAAAAEALTAFGGACYGLLNNVGVLDAYAPILDTDEALWDRIMGANIKGMYLVTRALLPSMITGGGGAIVNTSSISGLIAGGGGIAYTTSKHAVIGFTKQMAFDYAKQGIRVNAIAPGAVETELTRDILNNEELEVVKGIRSAPAGRHSQPEEIAALSLFLLGDEATFTHGAVYVADGGWTIL